MFKMAVLALTILVVVSNLVGCGKQGNFTSTSSVTPSEPTDTQMTIPSYLNYPTFPLRIHANPNKIYLPGEAVEIKFSFKNEGQLSIQISPIPPIMHIQEMFDSISFHVVRSFTAGPDVKSLNPGEVFDFTLTWDQRNNDGHQVEPGFYTITVKNMNIQDAEGNSFGLGEATPAKFTIK